MQCELRNVGLFINTYGTISFGDGNLDALVRWFDQGETMTGDCGNMVNMNEINK